MIKKIKNLPYFQYNRRIAYFLALKNCKNLYKRKKINNLRTRLKEILIGKHFNQRVRLNIQLIIDSYIISKIFL